MLNSWIRARLRELESRMTLVEAGEAPPTVRVKKLHPDAIVPQYQTLGAAGMDLVACVDAPVTVWPDVDAVLIPTGIAIELPPGYEAQVRPRSGLSLKGIAVANAPGTIDEDYRGEVKVIVRNHGKMLVVHKGDRIAQLVVAKVARAVAVEVEELGTTTRGVGGFGSTG